MPNLVKRDLVVMGASAGGIEAFFRVLAALPKNLEASILAVQHMSADSASELPALLARKTLLPVDWATDGATLRPGHVLVAPPGRHTLVYEDHVVIREGPRENRARPAINRLFRSAAAVGGARVVAVVMSGMLDDGTAGAVAVRRSGGHVIVQDPGQAAYPEMPRHVAESVSDAEVLPLDRIAPQIIARIAERAPVVPIPRDITIEAELDRTQAPDFAALRTLGPQSNVSCPECGGPTWSVGAAGHVRAFRCYLGHSSTTRTVLASTGEQIEQSLWTALRALEDRVTAYEALARDASEFAAPRAVQNYEEGAAVTREHVARLRELLATVRRRD